MAPGDGQWRGYPKMCSAQRRDERRETPCGASVEHESGGSAQGGRLYADAGNTALKWAVRAEGAWIAEGRLPIDALTGEARRASEEMAQALTAEGIFPENLAGTALVCSRLSDVAEIERALQDAIGTRIALLGRDLDAGIATTYEDPAQIGQDRLALAEGAVEMVGAPVIAIALGTCITAQWIDADAVMTGGAIAAGIAAQVKGIGQAVPHLSNAVMQAAELLRQDHEMIAARQSTVGSLARGLAASVRGTVEALLERARGEVGDVPVIATGGDAALAKHLGAPFSHVEDLLVLEGLRVADERSRER